jgi:hypothetical protein
LRYRTILWVRLSGQEGLSNKNSLFDRGSIGEMGLWVKGKASQYIVVMDKRVQRILAIEAKGNSSGGKLDGEHYCFDIGASKLFNNSTTFRKKIGKCPYFCYGIGEGNLDKFSNVGDPGLGNCIARPTTEIQTRLRLNTVTWKAGYTSR